MARRNEEADVDRVSDWVDLIHDLYPPSNAADWDSVGLQVGDPADPVERILVTLDVTSAVIGEAAHGPTTLIVAHHPLIFQPLGQLTPTTATGRIALAAARAEVAVLAAHTNLDVAQDGAGTSYPVMRALGIADSRPLTGDTEGSHEVKVVTFVPTEHVDPVLDSLAEAGAGVIGDYERCSFRVVGTGTFRPGLDADPYSGAIGEDNEETEARLEIVAPGGRLAGVVRALLDAHPYEEVAYDVYPLVHPAPGFGRIGELDAPLALSEVADRVRSGLPAPHLRYAGDPHREVCRVAAVGGSGDSLVPAALRAGADVLITGDLKHHVTLDALEMGLAMIDAGHHATEVAAMPALIERLREESARRVLEAEVVASSVPTVPWV